MEHFDVWSQQPSHMHIAVPAPAPAPAHIQPQPAASIPRDCCAKVSSQLAPLTLEAYMNVHRAVTGGSQTVQQTMPADVCKIKVQELKQACIVLQMPSSPVQSRLTPRGNASLRCTVPEGHPCCLSDTGC